MKILKGDKVIVLSGKDKGQSGKVLKVLPRLNKVIVDGINVVKRSYKPSQTRPKGGIKEIPAPVWLSKVGLVHPEKPKKASRVGYIVKPNGQKVRVYRQAKNKPVKP